MITCRTATLPELEQVLAWAAEEGWNPGINDAEAFFAADPAGFFVAARADGELVASISVVNHTPDFAFLGLYIVRPMFRRQGIGLALWRHAMQHADKRVVGLDGVEAQQENYEKSGFAHAGGTTRFTGNVAGVRNKSIRSATSDDIPKLIGLEASAAGVSKPDYLRAWLSPSSKRTTFVLTKGQGGGLDGYCTARACASGAKIGPLVANTAKSAHELIAHAAAHYEGPVTLDVPESADELTQLCLDLGLRPGFKTARMYKGMFPLTSHRFFAVTSLELG